MSPEYDKWLDHARLSSLSLEDWRALELSRKA